MIKYSLICECGKNFESWFSSSREYDLLKKKNFISCIYCDSTNIKKSVMSPNLPSKSNKIINKNKLEKSVRKQLVDFRRYIEKNCKNVGDKSLSFTRANQLEIKNYKRK